MSASTLRVFVALLAVALVCGPARSAEPAARGPGGSASVPALGLEADQPPTPPVRLTLGRALRLALEENPGFASARESYQAARGRHRQARSALLPQVAAAASKTEQSRPDVQLSGLSLFGSSLFATDLTDQRVTLVQPILDLRSRALVRSSRHQTRASDQDVGKARVDLVTAVKNTFYDLLLSAETEAVSSSTVQQVDRQLAQARLRVQAGAAPRVDELRAQVELARVRADLIRAQYGRELARETLANLLGLEPTTPLDPSGDFAPVSAVEPRPVLVARALSNRPDLNAARERARAARSALDAARAGRLPTVTLTGLYDKSKGQRFPLNQEIDLQSATVGINLPLFDGQLTDGRVQENEALLRKANHDVDTLRHAVELDVTRALALVAQATAVLAATDTAIQNALETLQISEEGYRQGVRTYLEVLDAQLSLAVTRNSRAQARRDYSVARSQLDAAQGLLTGLEPEPPGGGSASGARPRASSSNGPGTGGAGILR